MKKNTITKHLIVLWLLNMFDIFATLFGIMSGYAREANPFMAFIIGKGYFFAILFKAISLGIGCVFMNWLYNNGNYKTKWSVWFLLGLYIFIDVWHVFLYSYWKFFF